MSEMSSFYGGRQGSPFIIVKRFDGIDIPQSVEHPVYTNRSYAMDEVDTNLFKLVTREQGGNVPVDEANNVYLIGKNGLNKRDYTFKNHFNDGTQINDTQYHFPQKLAEGMVQCFAKGAKSASEVNYGEYVLIDTVEEVNDYVNPDNGKVFRRGMNIDSELAGAEYIGCIVGPKGETIELKYGHYEDIYNQPHTGDGQYDIDHDDLVFGSYIDEVTGDRVYEDAIKYAYVTLVDEYNNVIGSLIGFKIPTLVEEYEARSMSPYEQRATDPETGKYYNYDLISEDPEQYIDNRWQHSYYQKWQIKVPHGYHGVNVGDLQIVPTKTMPAGFKSNDYEGTKVYSDPDLAEAHEIGLLTTATDVILTNYDPENNYVEVEYEGETAYVAKDDCYGDMVRYKETNFDNLEAGEDTYFLIGYVDTIERISLSDNGILTVYYRGNKQHEDVEEKIRWIDTVGSEGVVLDDDGTLHVYFNTTHAPVGTITDPYEVVDTQGRAHDHQDFIKKIRWITRITIDDDGTISFYDNTNPSQPFYQREKFLKAIVDVQIQTVAANETDEGTGDQKVHVTYNITDALGERVQEAIGNPLNYVIETAISVPNMTYPDVPYCHLLVYYADPALRALHQDKWVTWPSSKYPNKIWTEWVDLGVCRGVAGGLHILKDVQSLDELKDEHGDFIPPERLEDENDHVINPEAAGWSCSLTILGYMEVTTQDPDYLEIVPDGTSPLGEHEVEISTVEEYNPGDFEIGDIVQFGKLKPTEILFYDYEIKQWFSIGSLDMSAIDPRYIIVKSRPQEGTMEPDPEDTEMMNPHGIWFASQTMLSAY